MEQNTSKVLAGAFAEPLAAMPIAATGEGSSLFVINLCASMAPVPVAGKSLPGLDNYRLYQVTRKEDGRTRYRLRLGFFTTEADAELVLAKVREQYPTAFTTCLCEEDRRFARGFVPDTTTTGTNRSPVAIVSDTTARTPTPVLPPSKPTAPVAQKTTPAAPKAAAPKPAPTAPASSEVIELTWEPETPPKAPATDTARAPVPPAVAPDDALGDLSWEAPQLAPKADRTTIPAKAATTPVIKSESPVRNSAPPAPVAPAEPAKAAPSISPSRKLELLLEADPPAPATAPRKNGSADQPFHVGKGVEIPASALTLQAEPAAAKPAAASAPSAPTPTAKPATKPAAPKSTKAVTAAKPPVAPAPAAPVTKVMPAPDLDSTQTIRALTSAELNDEQQEKWFAIQLAASEQPVNLDAMPHLDIFEAYRLYSVATAGSGKIVHSLRLGFFKESVSAEAVAGYLKTFFASPSVMRISLAEHTRFKDPPAATKKPQQVEAEAKVIEINSARQPRPIIPTVTMEVDTSATGTFRPNATGAFDASATGTFKPNATGSFKANATGSFKTGTSGKHKTLQPAAKHAGLPTKSSDAVRARTSSTGRHKVPVAKKSLSEQLLDEARQVELSESGIRKLPKSDSLLSRMLGKLTK